MGHIIGDMMGVVSQRSFFMMMICFGSMYTKNQLFYNKTLTILSQKSKNFLWVRPSRKKKAGLYYELLGGDPLYQRDNNNSQLFIFKNKNNKEKSGPVLYGDMLHIYALGHGGFRKKGFTLFPSPCPLTVSSQGHNKDNPQLVVDLKPQHDVSLSSTFVISSPEKKTGFVKQGDIVCLTNKKVKENIWEYDESRLGKNFKQYRIGDTWGKQMPGLGDRSKKLTAFFQLAHAQKKEKKINVKKKKKALAAYRLIKPLKAMKKRWKDRVTMLSQKRKKRREKKP